MGGMGEVYTGKLVQTGDKVAIKMILPEHANNELILDLFRKEASTLHNLYHEAIVRYYVFSVDPVLDLAIATSQDSLPGSRVSPWAAVFPCASCPTGRVTACWSHWATTAQRLNNG